MCESIRGENNDRGWFTAESNAEAGLKEGKFEPKHRLRMQGSLKKTRERRKGNQGSITCVQFRGRSVIWKVQLERAKKEVNSEGEEDGIQQAKKKSTSAVPSCMN